jgi:hypothetical protein
MKNYLLVILVFTLLVILTTAQDAIVALPTTEPSLLSKLQVGMSTAEAEAITGVPMNYLNAGKLGGDSNLVLATYYCPVEDDPCPLCQITTVHYRITDKGTNLSHMHLGPYDIEKIRAQQAGPGYPPQGVGSPDP